MFTISDLHVKADDKEILKGFNLTINEAETHILMGPNGAGKSTVCKSNYFVSIIIRYAIKGVVCKVAIQK